MTLILGGNLIYIMEARCAYCGTNLTNEGLIDRTLFKFCSMDHAIEWELRKAIDVH
jgi:hypothetical protein